MNTFARLNAITMPPIKIFIAPLVFATCLFAACNPSGQQASQQTADTQTTGAGEPTIVMVMAHHVKDFAGWTTHFYAHEAARQAAQLKVLGVFQDLSDPGYVSVSLSVGNMDAAKEFAASEDLKNVMAQAGVTDQPEVKFYAFAYMDTVAAKISDLRLFIIHKVQDYDAWKKVFDEYESVRQAEGISTVIVARNVDDPSEVAVSLTAAGADVLSQHTGKPEIKEAMQKAGVAGEPSVMLARKVPSSVI